METVLEAPRSLGITASREGVSGEIKEHDMQLIEKVRNLLDSRVWTSQAGLGRQIGVSGSVISTWLAGRYRGDVTSLEAKIRNAIENLALQQDAPARTEDFVETTVSQRVWGAVERIVKMQVVGLVMGEPGIGKTTAIEKYHALKPTSIMVTIAKCNGSDWALARQLCRSIGKASAQGSYASEWDFLVATLKGSGRLLLIDNGHKFNTTGWEFVFDLHDATRIPIAVFGNPCMQDDIRGYTARQRGRNEQHVDRVGQRQYIEFKCSKDQLTTFVKTHFANPNDELLEHCLRVARGQGHLRALHHVLRDACETLGDDDGDQVSAFEEAWARRNPPVRHAAV
jgi:DNA transposition AAA+ family ATPase